MLSVSSLAREVVHLPVPYLAQPDDQTCLPTSLLMAMHFLGRIDLGGSVVQSLQPRCHYDRFNTPALLRDYGLYGLATWRGMAWTRETVEHELDLGHPVVLGLGCSRPGHFVLAIGYTDDHRVILHDPWHKDPGWPLGGPNVTTDWDRLQWRGGIMVHPEPFPERAAISGTLVDASGHTVEDYLLSPRRMVSGDTAEVVVRVKNNGSATWPKEVYLAPVDADATPVKGRESAFSAGVDWVSSNRIVAPDRAEIAPGEIAQFIFKIHAPDVAKTTTFEENWNLVDGSGHWFSDSWLAGPNNRQICNLISVDPRLPWQLPLAETAADGKASLPWQVKFGELTKAGDSARAPDAPGSDPQAAAPDGAPALHLFSAGKPFDSAWVGDGAWRDYRVESWIYCDLHPEDKPDGWNRAGIFIRDNGEHAGDTIGPVEVGACLAMTYDSDDGYIRAANILKGGAEDFRDKPYRLTESGWHKFAIRCSGDDVTYELDGQPFHQARFAALKSGDCGVYYRAAFYHVENAHGITFAGFHVEK